MTAQPQIKEILERAIKEKIPVMIKYHGGSQPGAKRWILPLMLTATQLRAEDVATNRAKRFVLAKIEIVDEHDGGEDYVEQKKKTTLSERLKGKVAELESIGWRVILSDESIELFEPGNDKATVAIKANISTSTVISITLDDSSVDQETKRSDDLPWCVFGPGVAAQIIDPEPDDDLGVSYKRLGSAVDAFLKEARRYAPKPK